MKEIWFIRHAESAANAGETTSESAQIPLTQKGKEQAIALSKELNRRPDVIIHSKFIRTYQTAEATIQKFPNVPVQESSILHEFDFLSPTLCVNTTGIQRRPMVEAYWNRSEANYIHGAGAESYLQFRKRTFDALKQLEKTEAKLCYVFCHGHVIRAIWEYFMTSNTLFDDATMAYSKNVFEKIAVKNTAIFKANFDGHQWNMIHPIIKK